MCDNVMRITWIVQYEDSVLSTVEWEHEQEQFFYVTNSLNCYDIYRNMNE